MTARQFGKVARSRIAPLDTTADLGVIRFVLNTIGKEDKFVQFSVLKQIELTRGLINTPSWQTKWIFIRNKQRTTGKTRFIIIKYLIFEKAQFLKSYYKINATEVYLFFVILQNNLAKLFFTWLYL